MAKTPPQKSGSLNKIHADTLQRIEGVMKNDSVIQTEQTSILKTIAHISEQERLLGVASNLQEYQINKREEESLKSTHEIEKDEDESLKEFKILNKNVKSLLDIMSDSITGGPKKLANKNTEIGNPEAFDSAAKLIPTSESTEADASEAKKLKKNRSAATKTLDFFDKTGIVKRGSTGMFSKMYGLPEVAKKEEQEKYVKREQELGNERAPERLEKDFDELQIFLKKQEVNKGEIERTKKELNLTDDQFGKTKRGKVLLGSEGSVGEMEKIAMAIEKLDSTIGGVEKSELPTVGPLPEEDATPNDTPHEREVELDKVNQEQSDLLHKIEENTRVKDIPEEPKVEPIPPAEVAQVPDGSGLGDAVSGIGKFAAAAAIPLAVGVAGAAVARGAAEVYSNSFGEGGFDVIHALHKQGIIDYNFGDSEILDWKAVEQLPDDTIQKMIDANEFSEEDTKKLEDIIKGNKMVFKPALKTESDKLFNEKMKDYPKQLQEDADNRNEVRDEADIEARAILKERGINPYDNVNGNGEVQRVGEQQQQQVRDSLNNSFEKSPVETPQDLVVKPEAQKASEVYNESAEVAESAMKSPVSNNTVVAPTTINNSTVNQQSNRTPVRNEDTTARKYVSSRSSVQ